MVFVSKLSILSTYLWYSLQYLVSYTICMIILQDIKPWHVCSRRICKFYVFRRWFNLYKPYMNSYYEVITVNISSSNFTYFLIIFLPFNVCTYLLFNIVGHNKFLTAFNTKNFTFSNVLFKLLKQYLTHYFCNFITKQLIILKM